MSRRKVEQQVRPAISPGEPEIWKLAAILVHRLKAKAPDFTAGRGEQARRTGDIATGRLWTRLNAAVEELLKPSPDDDEAVH